MIGRIPIKRLIKRVSGRAAVVQNQFRAMRETPHACVFAYHRISNISFVDSKLDDWNVSPQRFEEHVKAASEFGEIIPIENLFDRLSTATTNKRPLVCFTFDDGFANFFLHALPVLIRYEAHASLFVPTSQIGKTDPMPFDRWGKKYAQSQPDDAWRPITWNELDKCLDSGYVSVGSHSHDHLNAVESTTEQLVYESEKSRALLVDRLGPQAGITYAYPYGSSRLGQVNEDYVAAVKNAGYTQALSTDLGLTSEPSNEYLIPRVEAHQVDSPSVIRAKMSGALQPYFFADQMRKSRRR